MYAMVVMLMSYLVWLRSHEPSTYQLISVKSFLNHFQYLKVHNFHVNLVSKKDSMKRFMVSHAWQHGPFFSQEQTTKGGRFENTVDSSGATVQCESLSCGPLDV